MKKTFIAILLTILMASVVHAGQIKIWYKDSAPTIVISFGKSAGSAGESSFLSTYPAEMDNEFYTIGQGPPKVLVRKSQSIIDSIIAARVQARADYQQKQTDATSQLTLNDLADKSYADVETWIDNQVTDLASARTALKKLAKIILAMLKKGNWSD